MWTVSDRFTQSTAQHHELVTTCTVTPPGGTATTLAVSSGTVSIDRTQQMRRTATLTVRGGTDLYALLSTPGARLTVQHGFKWTGAEQELVPMITGELTSAALTIGDGTVTIAIADRWQRLAATMWLTAYTPPSASSRVAEIISAVTGLFPGILIRNTATDLGPVATSQAWTSPADMIASFATDGGLEAFFAPDGSFVIRDLPQITDQPAYLIKTGPGGTLETLTRTRPLDKLYNTVILTPATADASQTWTQVVAQITDTANPRHPDKIGIRPYPYASPTALTEAEAEDIAARLLVKVQGTTETLDLTAVAMPALEGGDVVRVLTPADSGDTIVNHFLQQISVDLASGSMTANTRSDMELTA